MIKQLADLAAERQLLICAGEGARARHAYLIAADLGRRVRVSGLFTVTFELGYEILVARIADA